MNQYDTPYFPVDFILNYIKNEKNLFPLGIAHLIALLFEYVTISYFLWYSKGSFVNNENLDYEIFENFNPDEADEGISYGLIYAKTDKHGWLKVQNISGYENFILEDLMD